MRDFISRHFAHSLGGILVVELCLGLPLETRRRMFDGHDGCHAVAHVGACEIDVLLLQDIEFTRVVVDDRREHRLESGQVRAALRVVYVVAEAKHVFVKFIDVLERAFHGDILADTCKIYDIVQCFFIFIQILDISDDPLRLRVGDDLRLLAAQVRENDREFRIQVSCLMESALHVLRLEPCPVKYRRIGRKIDGSTRLLCLSDHRKKSVDQFNDRIAVLVFVLVDQPVAPDRDGELCRERVDDGGTHTVQTAAGLVRAVIKFAACVERREDDSLRADPFLVHPDRDPPAVVRYGGGTVLL